MNKSFSLHQLLLITCFSIVATISITVMAFQGFTAGNNKSIVDAYSAKIREIESLVDEYYTGDVDRKTLIDSISAGYIMGLNDKYSDYVTAEAAEENLNTFFGLNTGMGIQIVMHPDNKCIYVLEIHDDSPAKTAGILKGDLIIKVDGHEVSDFGYTQTLLYIKQKPLNSVVHLVINRNGETVEVDVTLTQYASQSVFYRLFGSKGYIQIVDFNERSVDQMKSAINELIAAGATSLIFDLRGNGGGTLTSVYNMLDYLLPEGLVVRVEYKDSSNNQVFMSDSKHIDMPMVVLTDENTASAAELFAQSLKDYNKAVTVGRKTYGKGVVQRTFTLSDGSLVKFTVAKYYTANGTCLDGIGVVPDISVEWTESELTYRLVNGIEVDKEFIAACNYLDSKN